MFGFQDTPVTGLTFAVFNGDLIFLARLGKVSKFIADRWCECPDLQLPPQISGDVSGLKPIYTVLATASLFGEARDSLIVLEAQSESGDSLLTFRYLQDDSQWSQPSRLQKGICCTSNNPHNSTCRSDYRRPGFNCVV